MASYGSPDRAELIERPATLTDQEPETAGLVTQGLTSQAVADRLCVSRRTVETSATAVSAGKPPT
ncbi:LuxR C-terminal-related transcriptional regulator [Streptomyces phyllanthi]|uniref:LuxR C-terminal-related transcriptional regulator n=1 Tax=Streptomyces phyllanthi TaxID=1803180 RepID=UPI002AD533EE|nr:LuxR C-terminal-related transcriptional regulator [Streptomyces phyllanthi]